jgi:hypothetical protein
MKKAGIAAVLLIAAGTASVYGQNPRVFIQAIRGTVELKAPGSTEWTAAAEGQTLEQSTVISTGFGSSALIKMGNTTLMVRPLTRLSLEEIAAAAAEERINIRLNSGRIRVAVNPPGPGVSANFTVRSPIATASVRGTVFEFDTMNLGVEEGTVYFAGAGSGAVYVRAGQSSFPDPELGHLAAPVDTEGVLSVPLPAGVEETSAPPAVIPASAPGQVPVRVGIRWPGLTN